MVFFVMLLISVAYMTLFERHLLGLSQLRYGPNKPLLVGFFQPFMDALKLLQKESLNLYKSNNLYYFLSPMLMMILFYLYWYSAPYEWMWTSMEYASLYLLCLVGLSVYTKFMAGYYSGSKYSYLGAIRSTVQSVSFEVTYFFILLSYLVILSNYEFTIFGSMMMVPLFILWIICILVELSRAPMDFSEAESELVSGYNLEFSGVGFILFFLSEYGFLLFWSSLTSYLFFSWSGLPSLLFYFIMWLLLFCRSVFPRYRYDLLMGFFWYKMLPLSMLFLLMMYLLI